MSLDADKSTAGPPVRRFQYGTVSGFGGSVPALELEPALPLDWTRIWWTLAAAAIGLYLLFPTDLRGLVDRWSSDSGWSHGFVVPLISLFFIRLKWPTLRRLVPRGTWMGLLVLLIGVCGQVLFRATGLVHMSILSIIVVMFGIVLFVFGWNHLKILWLPIAYMVFAMPPPTPLYVRVTTPMQTIAAELGVRLLPLFGCEAVRSGTVINLSSGHQLNVEQACSGMRMLVAFFALAVALAYSTNRPVWQKLLLAACALPIAIFCNGLRVTFTGVASERLGEEWAKGKTHEYMGLLMLGPALAMQLGVAWVLDRIFIEVPDAPRGGDA